MSDDLEAKARGGFARAEVLSPEKRTEIARKGALARWGADEIPRAEYTGKLKIGDMVFPCSVLSDGTRILTQSDFMKGMGMYYSGWVARNRTEADESAEVPHFLSFKSLKPFVDRHLGDLQSIILKYRTATGGTAHGIRAEIIPKICEIWMDAEEGASLGVRQKQIVAKAKVLMRSLAHIGIIALVDEATGYQGVRPKDALQMYLEKIIRKELAAWAKKFPDEFYENIYKLKNWPWPGMKKNRYSVVAHYTRNLVYERLAAGLLKELEAKSPKNDSGNRPNKLHQWLTEDIGGPASGATPALNYYVSAAGNYQRIRMESLYEDGGSGDAQAGHKSPAAVPGRGSRLICGIRGYMRKPEDGKSSPARPDRENNEISNRRDLGEVLAEIDLSEEEAKAWHRDLQAARRMLKPPSARDGSRRLASLGGTMPHLKKIPRRKV